MRACATEMVQGLLSRLALPKGVSSLCLMYRNQIVDVSELCLLEGLPDCGRVVHHWKKACPNLTELHVSRNPISHKTEVDRL